MTAEITYAIPFYRDVEYLRRAIESVLAQRDGRWDLVVVDDAGPEPEAAELVRGYGDDRMRYERNPENLGLAGNWNRCLETSDTELVTILHADDMLRPDYGALVTRAHRDFPDATAVYTRAQVIGPDDQITFSFPDYVKRFIEERGQEIAVVEGEPGLARLMRGQFIFCPSLCYRRSRVGAAPFDPRWRMVIDLAFLSTALLDGETLVGLPQPLYAYRRHAGSQTTQLTESTERFAEELEIFDEIADRAELRGWAHAARVARHKRIVRLHLAYRVFEDLARGRRAAARDKLAMLRQA